ncbi:MAG: rhodanese-like domain-containing protein [Lachnospiraceae bacterium]
MNHIIDYAYRVDGVIIDVREEDEYLDGHVPSAINIPYEAMEEERAHLKKGPPLIFYCDRGSQSILAARKYAEQGYDVINTVGGYAYYKGYPEKTRQTRSGFGYEKNA